MIQALDEARFIEVLTAGIKETKNLMARLTEFHGGKIDTEYILTVDIARAFVESGHEVKVECKNRHLVSALVANNGVNVWKILRGKRTDVAITSAGIFPLALIEVKIRVSQLKHIKEDLDKISTTVRLMNPAPASKVIGAAVFQVHVNASSGRFHGHQFKAAIVEIEDRLTKQLADYAAAHPDFSYRLQPLQGPDDGIQGTAIERDEHEAWLGEDGHATRYYAVLIRSMRPVPPAHTHIAERLTQNNERKEEKVIS